MNMLAEIKLLKIHTVIKAHIRYIRYITTSETPKIGKSISIGVEICIFRVNGIDT